MKSVLIAAVLLATSTNAYSQVVSEEKTAAPAATSNTSINTATTPGTVTTSRPLPDIVAPKFGPYTMSAGVKSTNTGGRSIELNDTNGRRYKMKHEYYSGLTHKSGWGLSAMAVTSGNLYATQKVKQDNVGAGDPSLTLIHPKFYDENGLRLTGQFRSYFPVTDRSNNRSQHQFAYYLYTNYSLPRGMAVWNQLTPRYFAQSYYKPADTTYLVEDISTLTQEMNSWLKIGVGQHSQVEYHDKTKTGVVAEVYPLVNFVFSRNIFIEARVNMPVYTNEGAVYEAPTTVGLDQAQPELFMQISI